MISSEMDLDRCRKKLDELTDEQLLDEAALYDHMAMRESAYENWYAVDLFVDANRMFLGEYYDRIERRAAKAAAAEARKRKAASTIGQRIPAETRDKLLALKASLA